MRPALALPLVALALAACSSDRNLGPRGGALDVPESLVYTSLNNAVQLYRSANARRYRWNVESGDALRDVADARAGAVAQHGDR